MKCSFGISNFLEEISSLSHSIVFLYFFALITEEGFLISPCYSLELHSDRYAAAKSLQSCPTLCDPIDGSPPGAPVPGILQARTLEWVAISFSNAWKWEVKVKSLSHVRLLATPWTAAHQAPPSMGFSRQEYWSGVPLPSPSDRYIFSFLLCLLFLLSQLSVRPPQTTVLPFCISLFLEHEKESHRWSWPPVQCYKPASIVF